MIKFLGKNYLEKNENTYKSQRVLSGIMEHAVMSSHDNGPMCQPHTLQFYFFIFIF
jgi:hypothetical protein